MAKLKAEVVLVKRRNERDAGNIKETGKTGWDAQGEEDDGAKDAQVQANIRKGGRPSSVAKSSLLYSWFHYVVALGYR